MALYDVYAECGANDGGNPPLIGPVRAPKAAMMPDRTENVANDCVVTNAG